MKPKRWVVVACGVAMLVACATSNSQALSLSGGQTIVIQNSYSHCVIPSQQTASITITSVRVPSDAPWPTWLKRVKAFGVKVDLNIVGPTGTSQRASFPIGALVTQIVPDNSAPIIRATLKVNVMSHYKLENKNGPYAHIDIPLTLVKTNDNRGMRALINALSKITETMTLPASLFAPGVTAFSSFVNDMFAADSKPGTVYPNAQLGFELVDDASECRANDQALRTGYEVEIFSSPQRGPGVIDIGNYSKYCYYTTGGNDPNILFSRKSSTGPCLQKTPASAQMLNNPQVIFVVNAYPMRAPTRSAFISLPKSVAASGQLVAVSDTEWTTFVGLQPTLTTASTRPVSMADLQSLRTEVKQAAAAWKQESYVMSNPESSSKANSVALKLNAEQRRTFALAMALRNCALAGLNVKDCK